MLPVEIRHPIAAEQDAQPPIRAAPLHVHEVSFVCGRSALGSNDDGDVADSLVI